jgi:hypothetical protein
VAKFNYGLRTVLDGAPDGRAVVEAEGAMIFFLPGRRR